MAQDYNDVTHGLLSKVVKGAVVTKTEMNEAIQANVDRISARFDRKMDALEYRLESQINRFKADMDRRMDQINTNFRWIIGIFLSSLIAIPAIVKLLDMIH